MRTTPTRLTLLACFAFLLCFTAVAFKAQAQAAPERHVVVALTSGNQNDWQLTLGNVRNLLVGFPAGSTEVEVVSFGPGIAMVEKSSPVQSDIQALQAQHVRFVACQNSMRAHHLTTADLVTGVVPVPSGIVEVVTREQQGWLYIKGGQ